MNYSQKFLSCLMNNNRSFGFDGTITSVLIGLKRFSVIFIREQDEFKKVGIFLNILDSKLCPVVIPSSWSNQDVEQFLTDYPFKGYIIEREELKVFNKNLPEHDGEDFFYGVFSSGSTGKPSLYFHSRESAKENARAHLISMKIESGNVILKTLSIDHAFGLCCYIWSVVFSDKIFLYFCNNFLEWKSFNSVVLEKSVLHLTPRQLNFILRNKKDFSLYPFKISVGSDTVAKDKVIAIKDVSGSSIYITYGLTEAGPRVSTFEFSTYGECKILDNESCIGFPIDGVEVALWNDDDQIVKHGSGTIVIKSKSLASNLKKIKFKDGYYLTRDKGRIDEKGQIFIKQDEKHHFKFKDKLIDLNDLKLQLSQCLEDPIWAVVWQEGLRENWALVLSESLCKIVDMSRIDNIFGNMLKPTMLMWYNNQQLTALDKVSKESLKRLLGIKESNEIFVYRDNL